MYVALLFLYQYLIEISMYWRLDAWAWFSWNGFSPKRNQTTISHSVSLKDLIDSKDKCECKNGIPRLGWLKGSSLKKDLEHLCFWSSSKAWQEESCVMCACWAMPKKNTLPNLAPHGLKLTAEMHEWCAHGWCRRSHGSWCVGDGLLFALRGRVTVSVLCCVLFVPCVSPLAPPPALPPVRSGWSHARGLNSACAFLLHCSRLASSGWGSLSVFLSLRPCCFCFFFAFFKCYLSFAFHLLIH